MIDQPTPDAEARAQLIAELRNSDQRCVDYETTNCREQCDPISDWCGGCVRALLVDLLAAEGWRDISTYPKDAEYRLLYSSAHGQVVGAHVTGDVWHLVGVGAITDASSRPTRWMPLPAPPGGTR